jgi:hypothetical protein
MLGSTDPHRFRKTVAGLCMVGAPLLFLIGSIVSPELDSNESALIASASEHADRWLASALLVMAGWTLLLVATLGLMHMLRERGVAYGHAGGALAIIGCLAGIASASLSLVVWQMGAEGADSGQMAALLDRVTGTAGSAIPLVVLGFATTLGFLVLCWGLTVERIAPAWETGALAVGAIVFAVASVAYAAPLFIVASAFTLIGLGAIGRTVLAESVDDWEHAPQIGGTAAA